MPPRRLTPVVARGFLPLGLVLLLAPAGRAEARPPSVPVSEVERSAGRSAESWTARQLAHSRSVEDLARSEGEGRRSLRRKAWEARRPPGAWATSRRSDRTPPGASRRALGPDRPPVPRIDTQVAPPDDCEWSDDFAFGGLDGPVFAQAVFDDGTGEALYVGGDFSTAAGIPASFVARWDGTSWSALGSGTDDAVFALEVFDDGGGEALYAGGFFTTAGGVAASGIARWDGSGWAPLGAGVDDAVFALEVHDDGAGEDLYVGGSFSMAGGIVGNSVARWDGTSWSALGTGIGGREVEVDAFAVYDDGSGGGPALFVGGFFSSAGGVSAENVAKWDGSVWSALGSGTDDGVLALEVFDDGDGDDLYAGGFFAAAGGSLVFGIARWDGTSWASLASGMDAPVLSLTVGDDGGGEALYVGGFFQFADVVPAAGIARWDGISWTALGAGVAAPFLEEVDSLGFFDDGSGLRLYAGGIFFDAGNVAASFLASWDGSDWAGAATTGPSFQGLDDIALATVLFDDGTGTALYVGGAFSSAGGVPVYGIARWDGTTWSPLGSGLSCDGGFPDFPELDGERGVEPPELGCISPAAEALAVFDDGSGEALYVGGEFDEAGGIEASNIAKWDGTSWSAVGPGTDGLVEALAVFDDGGGEALYVGGEFDFAGPVLSPFVARWDGTLWSGLGLGLNDDVETLVVFDDGGGADLYAGGEFDAAGGAPAMYIARWDGAAWSTLGVGTDGEVEALFVHDDGGGADLYAGGRFDFAGGVPASSIARWDGTAWSGVGGGVAGPVEGRTVDALVEYETAPGSAELVAGGFFDAAGGVPAANVARWDGTSWAPLGLGTDEEVETLAVFDAGPGPALYAGGFFTEAGGFPSSAFGRWRCPLVDFGDAPDPTYPTLSGSDGARHSIVPGFHLGSGVDAEPDGLPDADATGDDLHGATDDEDGVAFSALVPGTTGSATVEASAAGQLDAWVDWNGDGDWNDLGEKVFDGTALAAGANVLSLVVPSDGVLGQVFTRFRFSTTGVGGPTGPAADGEVEDHVATIQAPAEVSIDSVGLDEGDAGTTDFVFTLTRSHALTAASIDVATTDGSAEDGTDYTGLPLQTVGFTAGGSLAQTITVLVAGDPRVEADETFQVVLSSPMALTIVGGPGVGTIENDDEATLVIDDVTLQEGTGGTTDFVFTVDLSVASDFPVSVDVATADGTAEDAAGDGDYDAVVDTLGFDPGVTSRTVTVTVHGDAVEEAPAEDFTVGLSGPTGATLADAEGIGTILDDDDQGPPTVTVVDSVGGTGDGMLEDCEEVRVAVDRLLVTFDQAVADPEGDTDPNDVTNPANYRLFAAGPDRDLASTACAAPVGDDVELAIGDVTWDEPSRTAEVDPAGAALGDGLHRLVVCDEIRDPAGNPLFGGDFARFFRVERTNRLVNGQLDCDLAGWTTVSTNPGEITFAGEDVDAASVSGSAGITNLTSSVDFALGQCAAVVGGLPHVLSGAVRLDSDATILVSRFCELFADPECAGASLGASIDFFPLADTSGGWERFSGIVTTPAESGSVLCGFATKALEGEEFEGWLDDLRLRPESGVFSDGFESGDTSAWSGEAR